MGRVTEPRLERLLLEPVARPPAARKTIGALEDETSHLTRFAPGSMKMVYVCRVSGMV